jgi:hypothetical protein
VPYVGIALPISDRANFIKNSLSTLPFFGKELPRLKTFNVSYNWTSEPPADGWSEMPGLQQLELSANNLSMSNTSVLAKLQHLTHIVVLNLSMNNSRAFPLS